jgi:hypothetical protein
MNTANLAIASNLAHYATSNAGRAALPALPAISALRGPWCVPSTHAAVSGAGIDPTFDYVVSLLAPRFRMASTQFADFAAMRDDFNACGILTVNTDFSDRTIFGTPYTNFQFRAWHDSAHIATNSDFSRDGELRAMRAQIAQVWALTGPSDTDKHRWACIIDAEVSGQLDAFLQTGEFVDDQRSFCVEYLARVHGLDAARFPRTLDGLTIEY